MKEITNVSVEILKVHPRNTEFFDDISGEEYERFKKSIQEDGILSPILVSPDMTIISGNQRYKAAVDLGMKLVPVIIREDFIDEDEKLKKLLVANFGRLKNDPIKQGKVYKEYETLCGVKQGNNQYNSLGNNSPSMSQEQIAKELGVDVTTIRNLKRLSTISLDLQDLISEGKITATTGYKVLSKLSLEEQEELIQSLDVTKRLTQKEVQTYVDKIKQLESRKPEVVEVEKVIDNTDYSSIEKKDNEIKQLNEKYNNLKERESILNERIDIIEKNSEKYKQLTNEIEKLTKDKSDIARRIVAVTSISGLTEKIDFMLKNELAPIKYSQALLEACTDDIVANNLSNIIYSVQRWCDEMKTYLPNDDKNNTIDMAEV